MSSVAYVRLYYRGSVPVAVAEEQTGTGGKENYLEALSLQNR